MNVPSSPATAPPPPLLEAITSLTITPHTADRRHCEGWTARALPLLRDDGYYDVLFDVCCGPLADGWSGQLSVAMSPAEGLAQVKTAELPIPGFGFVRGLHGPCNVWASAVPTPPMPMAVPRRLTYAAAGISAEERAVSAETGDPRVQCDLVPAAAGQSARLIFHSSTLHSTSLRFRLGDESGVARLTRGRCEVPLHHPPADFTGWLDEFSLPDEHEDE